MENYKINQPPIDRIPNLTDEIFERKPLPLGRAQFETWFERIYQLAMLSFEEGRESEFKLTCKHALANMLLHLPATESFKEDAYFIHSIRKACVNETAHAISLEIKAEREAKFKNKLEAVNE